MHLAVLNLAGVHHFRSVDGFPPFALKRDRSPSTLAREENQPSVLRQFVLLAAVSVDECGTAELGFTVLSSSFLFSSVQSESKGGGTVLNYNYMKENKQGKRGLNEEEGRGMEEKGGGKRKRKRETSKLA